jgi:soluble lytic murein transglycosylase-like protein
MTLASSPTTLARRCARTVLIAGLTGVLGVPLPASAAAELQRSESRHGESRHSPDRRPADRPPATDPPRWIVRKVIARKARQYGVDPQLALAVSWQEAGWQMHHVSSAGAIGAMQVMPDTGRWMELYADRPLYLRNIHDNATAGVLLLKVLNQMTTRGDTVIAAYYQGLGAVRDDGIYEETARYLANVEAIKRRLEHHRPPA